MNDRIDWKICPLKETFDPVCISFSENMTHTGTIITDKRVKLKSETEKQSVDDESKHNLYPNQNIGIYSFEGNIVTLVEVWF